MFIPLMINGLRSHGVIDSGAQVSILSTKLYHKLCDKPRLADSVIIKGINKSGTLQAKVAENLSLEVGKSKISVNMLVADIEDELILGLDFLEANKVIVDHGQYNIILNNEVIPATELSCQESESVKVYRVIIKETTILPPYSLQFVETKLNVKPTDDIVIQPSPKLEHILSPNSLCKPKQEICLLVRNPTDKEITLKKNKEFGSGIEAQMVLGKTETNLKTAKVRKTTTKLKTDEEIPDHMKDLFDRTANNLDKKQQYEVRKLLLEFQDVFSKGDFDIGLFNGNIKHKINTGNATPIK